MYPGVSVEEIFWRRMQRAFFPGWSTTVFVNTALLSIILTYYLVMDQIKGQKHDMESLLNIDLHAQIVFDDLLRNVTLGCGTLG
ncbi:hypothetical protein RvY_06991 [Ramazzottius varieornatus]|uniref:Uncharacterized protein n=1 Tax=Ramazzottius varieornatus TaxID=947166 RepID=A0A1D1V0U4_RAMVA|nr:hypothetical protein RvY_06991 [Ramazzottius varieornatus]